jgi:hypothetical protein
MVIASVAVSVSTGGEGLDVVVVVVDVGEWLMLHRIYFKGAADSLFYSWSK